MPESEMEREQEREVSRPDAYYEELRLLSNAKINREVAESMCRLSRKTPEEIAKSLAEDGQPFYALDYLELCELPQSEKNDILALAYGRKATKERKLVKQFPMARFDLAAEESEKMVRNLRGETEETK